MDMLPVKYFCHNCGGLLIRSGRELVTPVEVVCVKSQCRTKQIVCSYSREVGVFSMTDTSKAMDLRKQWRQSRGALMKNDRVVMHNDRAVMHTGMLKK